jgi:hypothetical protein
MSLIVLIIILLLLFGGGGGYYGYRSGWYGPNRVAGPGFNPMSIIWIILIIILIVWLVNELGYIRFR